MGGRFFFCCAAYSSKTAKSNSTLLIVSCGMKSAKFEDTEEYHSTLQCIVEKEGFD